MPSTLQRSQWPIQFKDAVIKPLWQLSTDLIFLPSELVQQSQRLARNDAQLNVLAQEQLRHFRDVAATTTSRLWQQKDYNNNNKGSITKNYFKITND